MPKLASLLRTVGQEQRWWEALELLKQLWHRKDRTTQDLSFPIVTTLEG